MVCRSPDAEEDVSCRKRLRSSSEGMNVVSGLPWSDDGLPDASGASMCSSFREGRCTRKLESKCTTESQRAESTRNRASCTSSVSRVARMRALK